MLTCCKPPCVSGHLSATPTLSCRTFAKDWPVPDAVKFHAQQLLSGQWDPYPIDMAFQPPCMVRAVSPLLTAHTACVMTLTVTSCCLCNPAFTISPKGCIRPPGVLEHDLSQHHESSRPVGSQVCITCAYNPGSACTYNSLLPAAGPSAHSPCMHVCCLSCRPSPRSALLSPARSCGAPQQTTVSATCTSSTCVHPPRKVRLGSVPAQQSTAQHSE
jgi:hypothetical protein